ncbi:hypothetical protein [Legionella jordanis]|uniref:Uncharacterized protein n=1 Tax=Legionella jordanis TaxID=456 RepID=A0A0W0VEX5_9GAMM|nr:hypothetical protein [Legionella jordanis]KTD18429.1 hypothetical protein Ljor_2735 [Legionella jordanis]RMX05335.1 hypothetical protein EAW55_01350 [Legionella jordanis]RMX20817.1 hypothetical protein EAS68_05715 [Legionella jordanis]VEH13222.1 Uncharacterised protein [Legionella jordanis]HAT8713579.1 hypothetical protein [Legionella jordanis]
MKLEQLLAQVTRNYEQFLQKKDIKALEDNLKLFEEVPAKEIKKLNKAGHQELLNCSNVLFTIAQSYVDYAYSIKEASELSSIKTLLGKANACYEHVLKAISLIPPFNLGELSQQNLKGIFLQKKLNFHYAELKFFFIQKELAANQGANVVDALKEVIQKYNDFSQLILSNYRRNYDEHLGLGTEFRNHIQNRLEEAKGLLAKIQAPEPKPATRELTATRDRRLEKQAQKKRKKIIIHEEKEIPAKESAKAQKEKHSSRPRKKMSSQLPARSREVEGRETAQPSLAMDEVHQKATTAATVTEKTSDSPELMQIASALTLLSTPMSPVTEFHSNTGFQFSVHSSSELAQKPAIDYRNDSESIYQKLEEWKESYARTHATISQEGQKALNFEKLGHVLLLAALKSQESNGQSTVPHPSFNLAISCFQRAAQLAPASRDGLVPNPSLRLEKLSTQYADLLHCFLPLLNQGKTSPLIAYSHFSKNIPSPERYLFTFGALLNQNPLIRLNGTSEKEAVEKIVECLCTHCSHQDYSQVIRFCSDSFSAASKHLAKMW